MLPAPEGNVVRVIAEYREVDGSKGGGRGRVAQRAPAYRLWEMVEWVYDGLVPNNAILGNGDTMMDLTMDVLGGLVAGCLAVRMLGHRKERRGART